MTPEELEKQAQKEKAAREKALAKIRLQQTLSAGIVIAGTSESAGLERLNQAVVNKVESLKGIATTQIQNFAEQLGISAIESATPTLPDLCPPQQVLDRVVQARDNLVGQLEVVAKYINVVNTALQIVSNVVGGTINSLTAINLLKVATNVATKTLPAVPGALTSLITDLDDVRTILTFKNDGNPRLPELKRAVNSGTAIISQASQTINVVLLVLKNIDLVLEKCGKQPKPLGEDITNLTKIAQTIQATNTETGYKGFAFEIVEKPFSPTLNQKIGQAKNSQGIVLLQTEPSFTNNPQQLIEELKFIIDRDNLKAN